MVDGEEVNDPILDENGNPEYIYSLRYEEFIALNTYVIQELWKRVDAVEKENIETKNQIKSMQQDIAELKKIRADYMTMCCVAGSFNSIPENREKERK